MKQKLFFKQATAGVSAGLCLSLLSVALRMEAANGTDTWTGSAGTANWSDAANWTGANTPPIAGDLLSFGTIGSGGAVLNNNLATTATTFAGIQFGPTAGSFTLTGNTVTNNAGTVDFSPNLETINLSISLPATHSITAASGASLLIGGVITGAGGITANGLGLVTLTNANTYAGTTTVGSGTLKADFSGAAAPAVNILPAGGALTLQGGTLSIVGNASSASYQTNGVLTLGGTGGIGAASTITLSGTTAPTLTLGTITEDAGASVVFNGPATIGAANASVSATGTINTKQAVVAGAASYGLLAYGQNNDAYATVGLYDWAATNSSGQVVGGSQVSGFYAVPGNNSQYNSASLNQDISTQETPSFGGTSNVRISSTATVYYDTVRFNSPLAPYVTIKSGNAYTVLGGILVTPNMGYINAGYDSIRTAANSTQIVQNNTAAVFCLGVNGQVVTFANDSNAGDNMIISGPGSVFLGPQSPLNIAFNYTNGTTLATSSSTTYNTAAINSSSWSPYYLNGSGVTVICYPGVLGNPSAGNQSYAAGGAGTVNLNGGTLMSAVNSFLLTNSLGSNRWVYLGYKGGGLAAQAGTTLTISGVVTNTLTGAGPLVIGIPASTANNSTAGLVPGTGTGTANGAVTASGTVNLVNSNLYSGGTIVDSGTVEIGSITNLGGSAYGGLTLNGGTLQYSTSAAGTLDLSTGNGVTVTANNGTVDVNGNAVTYANPITGAGSLTVASTAANGSLTLSGANSFTGNTAVNGGTLKLASGATLVSTNITVASGAVLDVSAGSYSLPANHFLLGSGVVTGSVTTASSATIVAGSLSTAGVLSFSNNLTLGGGVTNDFVLSSTTNGANSKVIVASALTLSGTNTVNIYFSGAPGIGRYTLYKYGTESGTAAANLRFNLSGASIGTLVASLSDSVSGEIDLVLNSAHSPSPITWIGDGTYNNWDLTSANWTNNSGGGSTVYYDFDYVTFNDAGSTNPAINLTRSLSPNTTTVNSTNNYEFSGPGQIAYGTLTKANTGTLTITTTNTLAGPISVLGGTLQLGDGTNSGTIGGGTITNNAQLVFDAPSSQQVGGITGTGNTTIDVGTVVLGGYSQLGNLTLGGASSATSATLDMAGNAVTAVNLNLGASATTSTIGNSSTNSSVTLYLQGTNNSVYNGVLQDTLGAGSKTLALNFNSTGSLTLGGANAYSGGTVVSNGIVYFAGIGNLGTGGVYLSGGTLACTAGGSTAVTFSDALTIAGGSVNTLFMSPRLTVNPVTGSGTLNLVVPGTVYGYDRLEGGGWSGFTGILNIIGTNTVTHLQGYYNGGGFDGNLVNAQVNLTSVDLATYNNSGGNSFYIGALSSDALSGLDGSDYAGGATYVVGALGLNTTFAGTISDGTVGGITSFRKVGTGTLTLSGTNTYTGPTLVSNGVLNVVGALGTSPVTNYSGATLTGSGLIGGSVDLENGSILNPAIGGYGTNNIGGSLTFNGGTNVVEISLTNSDIVNVGSSINFASGTVQLVVNQALTNGTYPIIYYSGGENGGVSSLNLAGFSQAGKIAFLSDTTSGQIDLVVANVGGAAVVWAASGVAQDNLWNIGASTDWLNGSTLQTFDTGDSVIFNDSGANNNPVDLRAALQASSMVVTGSQAYTFESITGSGYLTGTTNSLVAEGTGSLTVETVNNYGGPTTIGSGYTVTVGNGSDAATLGTGAYTNNGTLIYDQTNSQTLPNVTGTGSLQVNGASTVTLGGTYAYTGGTTIGTGATLQVGTGGATGLLPGAMTDNGTLALNISGTVAFTNGLTGSGALYQIGTAALTFGGTNTYQGNTAIQHGSVKVVAANAVPNAVTVSGSTGWLILDGNTTNAGSLDLAGFNVGANALSGLTGTALGVITNSAASGTNTLTIGNSNVVNLDTTFAGLIVDNTNSARIALDYEGLNTNYLNGANTYSGGTLVDQAYLGLGNSAGAGTGPVTLTNGATLDLSGNPVYYGNTTIIAANSTVTNSSALLGNVFESNFILGGINSTDVITGYVSLGNGTYEQFGTNVGTVVVAGGAQLRFASTALALSGGDNTTFDVEGTLNTRNGTTTTGYISLGALTGAGQVSGAGNAPGNIVYHIGAANLSTTFAGTLEDGGDGTTAVDKVGTGTLTLSGTVSYTGNTTISSGVLALASSAALDTSANISLSAATAGLDTSARSDGALNLGNSIAQTLNAQGFLNGSLNENSGSTVNVALGTFTVSNSVTLNGNVNLVINRTNTAANASELVSGISSITVSGPLTVTNLGTAIQAGDHFQLFNTAVSGFSSIKLPALTGSLVWTTNLAVDGSISIAGGAALNPTNIIYSVSGGTNLSITWPTDHLGWQLQVQTNHLSSGVSTNAADWGTISGTTGVTTTNLPINPSLANEYYRLYHP